MCTLRIQGRDDQCLAGEGRGCKAPWGRCRPRGKAGSVKKLTESEQLKVPEEPEKAEEAEKAEDELEKGGEEEPEKVDDEVIEAGAAAAAPEESFFDDTQRDVDLSRLRDGGAESYNMHCAVAHCPVKFFLAASQPEKQVWNTWHP